MLMMHKKERYVMEEYIRTCNTEYFREKRMQFVVTLRI